MDQLPVKFSPAELARAGRSAHISLPVSHFPRFSATLADDSGTVDIEVKFGRSEAGFITAIGKQGSAVNLICQRCTKPVEVESASDFALAFVKTEDDAEGLPDSLDPVLIGEEDEIAVVDFIEDELILQLPTRVVHRDEKQCDADVIAALSNKPESKTKTHNPFSGLGDLMNQSSVSSDNRSANMAVQKSKKSRSRRGMRRSHDKLSSPALSTDPTTGEIHLRHNVTPEGYYRGRKVIETVVEIDEDDE